MLSIYFIRRRAKAALPRPNEVMLKNSQPALPNVFISSSIATRLSPKIDLYSYLIEFFGLLFFSIAIVCWATSVFRSSVVEFEAAVCSRDDCVCLESSTASDLVVSLSLSNCLKIDLID